MKSISEMRWYRKVQSLFSYRRGSETSIVSDSTTIVDKDVEISYSDFAKLTGLKIIARTDTEDEILKDMERSQISQISLSISDTLGSSRSSDYPTLDDSFFFPPQSLKDGTLISKGNHSGSLPTMKTGQSVRSHHRSRSDGGACFMIPVGDTNELVKGRFTLKREEVDSSYFKPRRITGPSRFYD